ncbi:MAG TPA: hypothetical protein DD666_06500 [Advenella kashmirensis]|uniref:Uncharacterized protein n=1 Tax=Advenella kashmirensis TaxID=310575 RepID=A0A356LDJ7_9BURK|nr:hypothetical protein [Advenella kashmirensis]
MWFLLFYLFLKKSKIELPRNSPETPQKLPRNSPETPQKLPRIFRKTTHTVSMQKTAKGWQIQYFDRGKRLSATFPTQREYKE